MSAFEPSVLLRAEDSGGAISMIEIRVPAGWPGPPLHRHAFDEAFYLHLLAATGVAHSLVPSRADRL